MMPSGKEKRKHGVGVGRPGKACYKRLGEKRISASGTLCFALLRRGSFTFSAKILALLRLSVNFFRLRLTKKLKINSFVSKS